MMQYDVEEKSVLLVTVICLPHPAEIEAQRVCLLPRSVKK